MMGAYSRDQSVKLLLSKSYIQNVFCVASTRHAGLFEWNLMHVTVPSAGSVAINCTSLVTNFKALTAYLEGGEAINSDIMMLIVQYCQLVTEHIDCELIDAVLCLTHDVSQWLHVLQIKEMNSTLHAHH